MEGRSRCLSRWPQLMVAVVLLTGCARPSPPAAGEAPTSPPRTPTPVPATDEDAVLQLLAAEGEGIVEQDIERLMEIWAEEGVIVDARHTPDYGGDDLTWRGEDAIRQRYVTLVFPGNPAVAAPSDAQVTLSGDTAEVSSTTHIGSEVAPGGDRWTFERRDGQWFITSLTYNLEAK